MNKLFPSGPCDLTLYSIMRCSFLSDVVIFSDLGVWFRSTSELVTTSRHVSDLAVVEGLVVTDKCQTESCWKV